MSVLTVTLPEVALGVLQRAHSHTEHAQTLEALLEQAVAAGFVVQPTAQTESVAAIIKALQQLAQELPEVTPALWTTLAYIAETHGEEERSLMFDLDLPIPAEFADAVLHAALLTTPLWWHINTVVSEASGFVFNHFCGCGCHITRGSVVYQLTPEHLRQSADAFYTHLVGQYHLIQNGFPFNISA